MICRIKKLFSNEYDEDFVKKIEESREQFKKGQYKSININEIFKEIKNKEKRLLNKKTLNTIVNKKQIDMKKIIIADKEWELSDDENTLTSGDVKLHAVKLGTCDDCYFLSMCIIDDFNIPCSYGERNDCENVNFVNTVID